MAKSVSKSVILASGSRQRREDPRASRSEKAKDLMHFQVFQGLLVGSLLFHHAEDWGDVGFTTFTFVLLAAWTFFAKFRNELFFVVTVASLVKYLTKFPDLANHSNIYLYLLFVLLPLQLVVLLDKKNSDYSSLMQVVRWSIVTVYFFAVFHKLNYDFFKPVVSCANWKLVDYFDLIPVAFDSVVVFLQKLTPYLAILVEGAIPVLLVFGKTRKAAIVILAILHFTLAPMGFADFSSMAMALAWCFVDPKKISGKAIFKDLRLLLIAVLAVQGILAFWRLPKQTETLEFVEGLLLIPIYVPFLLKWLIPNLNTENLKMPKRKWTMAPVLLLFFFGFNNYLGLRTAGTFSMFSNLVTSGEKSNHILLTNNPFKVFDFQEDLVTVISVDDRFRGFWRKMPQPDQRIPRVEFAAMLKNIAAGNVKDFKMKVRYQGKVISTKAAGRDPYFNFAVPWWQTKLLKFRHVQAYRPQECWW